MWFSLNEPMPSVIKPTGLNALHVEAPGYAPFDSTFSIPGAFHITSPADGAQLVAGSQVTLEWTASQGAAGYEPAIPGSTTMASVIQQQSFTFTVPSQTGPLYVQVLASGPVMLPISVTGSASATATYQVVP
jgi:hypothetical protein